MQIAEGKRNPAISTGYIIRAGDTVVVWKNVAVFYKIWVDILIWCVFFNLYLLCKHAFDKVFTGQRFDFPFQCIYRLSEYDQKWDTEKTKDYEEDSFPYISVPICKAPENRCRHGNK